MKISIAQINCKAGDLPANREKILQYIIVAADQESDLIVFPEMADTGYSMNDASLAEDWHDGHTFMQDLRLAADHHNIAIICGLAEREQKQLYNSVLAIDKDGRLLQKYRKTHLFSLAGEDEVLTAGDEFIVTAINQYQAKEPIVRVGLMICYDVRFPEMCRKLVAEKFADILVVVAAFPFPRLEHWKTLTACRAMENQVFVVAANRVGTDKDLTFCGSSSIIDPFGTRIVAASETHEILLTQEIDLNRIQEARANMNLLQDRRTDLY